MLLRLGLLAALGGGVVWGAPGLRLDPGTPTIPTTTTPQDAATERAAARRRFGEAWQAFRSGVQSEPAELLAAAQVLSDLGRPDALIIARFTAALSPEARRRGWEQEQLVLGLRARVQDAYAATWQGDAPPEDWPTEREAIRTELHAVLAAIQPNGDPTPRAQAHALLARLDLARLDRDAGLAPMVRVDLTQTVQEHAQAALADFDRAGLRTPQLEPLWILAECERLTGTRSAAAARYAALEELAVTVEQPTYRARALRGRVALARESGDVHRLQRLLERWASWSSPETSWDLAHEQALALLHQDRVQAALDHLWRCQPDNAEERIAWQGLLAAALRRRGHLPAARRALERLQEEAPDEVERLALAEAQQLAAEGRHRHALEGLLTASSDLHWSPQGRVQAWILEGELRLQLGQAQAALAPLQAAGQAAEAWQTRRLGSGSVWGEWLGWHAVVLEAYALAQCGQLEQAALSIESRYARSWGGASRDELSQRIAALRTDGLGWMTFAFGPEFSLVLHFGPDGWQEFARLPITRGQVQTAWQRTRQALQDGDQERAQALQHELAQTLFPPAIAAGLPPARPLPERAALHVMMHGPLEEIALGDLAWHGEPLETRVRLVQRKALGREPAALDPGALARPWFWIGAPTTRAWPLLPAARAELTALHAKQPESSLEVGPHCIASAVEFACASNRPLHLATHLVVAPECEDPTLQAQALVLADDQTLCASTIAAWQPRLPLVYLGACASGTGRYLDGEGSLGLVHAFLAGGTRNVVATLWPVSDEGARAFGERFHAHIRAGLMPSEAVRRTRLALRAEGHPSRDWAAFVHWGED